MQLRGVRGKWQYEYKSKAKSERAGATAAVNFGMHPHKRWAFNSMIDDGKPGERMTVGRAFA